MLYRTEVAEVVLKFIIFGTYASIAAIALCFPILAFVPDGPVDHNGAVKLISDGFEQHPLVVKLVYGLGTTFLGISRFLLVAAFMDSSGAAAFDCILLIICKTSVILTIEVGIVQDVYHALSASVWITSSIAFQRDTLCWNARVQKDSPGLSNVARCIWVGSLTMGTIFLATYLLSYWYQLNQVFYVQIAVSEYLCAGMILANDLIMAVLLHRHHLVE